MADKINVKCMFLFLFSNKNKSSFETFMKWDLDLVSSLEKYKYLWMFVVKSEILKLKKKKKHISVYVGLYVSSILAQIFK